MKIFILYIKEISKVYQYDYNDYNSGKICFNDTYFPLKENQYSIRMYEDTDGDGYSDLQKLYVYEKDGNDDKMIFKSTYKENSLEEDKKLDKELQQKNPEIYRSRVDDRLMQNHTFGTYI